MASAAEPVLCSTDTDGVRTLTLNRPSRKNAINPQLWEELADALRVAARDTELRALVITGAGGAFCSGADISTPEDIHPRHKLRRLTEVALALHELTVPTIAKVTGVAVGAGWNLALGCDFVVATPESRFCQIFADRGLSVDLGGSWLLPRLVGLQQAKYLAFFGDVIEAHEAKEIGLVTRVVPHTELDDVAADFPGLKIILAHPSFPWQDEALSVATHKHNTWIDLSGWSPKYFPDSLVRAANSYLKKRVLFGSDATGRDFGAQLDSLCDLVTFGVAPAFLLVKMCPRFAYMNQHAIWVIAAAYAVCVALRLARFTLESDENDDHMHFSGLPSPAGAAAIASFAIMFFTLRKDDNPLMYAEQIDVALQTILPFFALLVAVLMVSRMPYPHLVNQIVRGAVP